LESALMSNIHAASRLCAVRYVFTLDPLRNPPKSQVHIYTQSFQWARTRRSSLIFIITCEFIAYAFLGFFLRVLSPVHPSHILAISVRCEYAIPASSP
jgi:hypothetical protein